MLAAKESDKSAYPPSKFIQLLNAHWWRRQLQGKCDVVAVSPGLIPYTGIIRGSDMKIPDNLPDAKSIPEGTFPAHSGMLDHVDLPENRRTKRPCSFLP